MNQVLGRIDLHDAQLEQTADGFVIHDDDKGKVFKLYDRDQATLDAWFFAVYAAIAEFERVQVETLPGDEEKITAAITSSFKDEVSDTVEFELTCDLQVSSRSPATPSIQWKVWKTADELHAFDE